MHPAGRQPLPKRLFETPSMNGPLDPARLANMLAIYRQRAGALAEESQGVRQ